VLRPAAAGCRATRRHNPGVLFQPIPRDPDSFHEPVSAAVVRAMCERAFGAGTDVVSAVELGDGSYNNVYRLDLAGREPAILRVAPAPARQFRIERELMRNEQAALPFFAPIAAMMPRTLFADWTHEIIGRDYVLQTVVPGDSVSSGALTRYPRAEWAAHYRQLGSIIRRVHAVRGTRFGPVAGPTFATWSDAVLSLFEHTVADLVDAGLDADDVRQVAAIARRGGAVLDEIRTPHLLHGDLWSNVLLDTTMPAPTIVGVIDHDRASWGDPLADWTIFLASRRSDAGRDAFWDVYGRPDTNQPTRWRQLVYRSAHLGAVRLERHRLHHDTIGETYADMATALAELRAVGN
jgi:aminoglycoside phosphotransferase (APT) family kinase protein